MNIQIPLKIANIKFQVSTFKQHSNFKLNNIGKKITFKFQQKITKTSCVANRIFFKIQDLFLSFISGQIKSTEYKIRKKN